MFRNWVKLSLRHLARHRANTLVNLLGLSLGLATCYVITLSILHDLRYDRFLPDSDRIVRFYNTWQDEEGIIQDRFTPCAGMLAVTVPEAFPEVESMVRMQAWGPRQIQPADVPLDVASGVLVETVYADSAFLRVFGYPMVEGNPRTAMNSPNKVLVTESTARALYPHESALGKPVIAGELTEAVIGGVLEDPPTTSHMQFGLVIPIFRTPENVYWFEAWDNQWVLLYAKLAPGVDRIALASKIRTFYDESNGISDGHYIHLMPLSDIHLKSSDQAFNWINANGRDMTSLMILGSLGLAILLIAVINYVNLATAQAVTRAREVGIRKSLGGSRRSLVPGYILESVMLTLIAGVIAVVLSQLALPYLQDILGRDLSRELTASVYLPLAMFAGVILIGVLGGFYPALVLAGYKPVTVLKGNFRTSRSGVILRRVLVVSQFSISIALAVAVMVINGQLHHILTQDLGYDREQVIIFEADGTENPADSRDLLLERLNSDPHIVAAGSANNLPGSNLPSLGVHPTGTPDPDSSLGMVVFDIRSEWFDALGIKVVNGRTLRTDGGADETDAVVINRAAADRLGLSDPIGKPFTFGWGEGLQRRTIVGVVDNFHFGTARDRTLPAFFHPGRQYSSRVFVRLQPGRIQEGIDATREVYRSIFNQRLIGIRFLDDQFEEIYKSDRAFASSVSIFSGLALVIACLGILGLTSFSVQQRRREIAVRKVLGASEPSLVRLLASGFLNWVLLANLIAWPVAYFLLSLWLDSFTLRIDLTFWPFVLAGLVALLLAAGTVAGQSIRASRMNPTDALRSE